LPSFGSNQISCWLQWNPAIISGPFYETRDRHGLVISSSEPHEPKHFSRITAEHKAGKACESPSAPRFRLERKILPRQPHDPFSDRKHLVAPHLRSVFQSDKRRRQRTHDRAFAESAPRHDLTDPSVDKRVHAFISFHASSWTTGRAASSTLYFFYRFLLPLRSYGTFSASRRHIWVSSSVGYNRVSNSQMQVVQRRVYASSSIILTACSTVGALEAPLVAA
jgi:hypothetical protein